MAISRRNSRLRRKVRIRQKVEGTGQRPRLTVFRSARHIYAQIVNDDERVVVAAAGTVGKTVADDMQGLNKTEQAKRIGKKIAELGKSKGIEKVVFDRNGYRYHGRIMALADAARENGLKF